MRKILLGILPASILMLLASVAYAKDDPGTSPEAGVRTYGENYKDLDAQVKRLVIHPKQIYR